MCNPIAIAGFSAAQQMLNMSALEHAGAKQFELNKQVATNDAINSYAALQARQSQEHAKAAQAISQAALDTRRRASAALTSAGESGATGNVAAQLASDFERVELNFQTTALRNQTMLDAQFKNELEGVHSQLYGRILSGQPGPIQQPDYIGLLGNAFGKQLEIGQQTSALNPVGPNGPVDINYNG